MKERLVGLIARHGESSLNASNCFRSWLDVPLNRQGLDEAHAAAKFLEAYPGRTNCMSRSIAAFFRGAWAFSPACQKRRIRRHCGCL